MKEKESQVRIILFHWSALKQNFERISAKVVFQIYDQWILFANIIMGTKIFIFCIKFLLGQITKVDLYNLDMLIRRTRRKNNSFYIKTLFYHHKISLIIFIIH